MSKPMIIYVDDEPMNLTVFEAALPTDWQIHVFDSPLKALEKVQELSPWVVVSDQKMPQMNGVTFLEKVIEIAPEAMRVIVTGFSDEDLVVDSVRKAQISDYIRKPWDVDDLAHRMQKQIETYELKREIKLQAKELEKANIDLKKALEAVEKARAYEVNLRKELECWAPPFILSQIDQQNSYPKTKDLVLITYDLIGSFEMHSITVDNKSAKAIIMHKFTEIVLKNGGWREHHAGDLAYAHFGLFKQVQNSCDVALASAVEFKNFIDVFNKKNSTHFSCGIGLHYAKKCLIDLHIVEVNTSEGIITQKSFDSSSLEVDLVFRIEKLAHTLPGTNIMMSELFKKKLINDTNLQQIMSYGLNNLKGYMQPTEVYILPDSNYVEQLKNPLKRTA